MSQIKRHSNTGKGFLFVLLIALAIPQVSEAAGFLKTQGQNMVDESGKTVLLRGVGLGNWYLPEGYMWKFGDQGDRVLRRKRSGHPSGWIRAGCHCQRQNEGRHPSCV